MSLKYEPSSEPPHISPLAPLQVVCAPPLVDNSTWGDFAPTSTNLELMEQTQRGHQAWDCDDFGESDETGLDAFSPVFARAAVGASAFTYAPVRDFFIDNLLVHRNDLVDQPRAMGG